jgi:predicted transposase YdaD
MLEELLRKESAEIKKKNLSENYGIKMSSATERKVNEMCNLSEVLVEKGIEQGIEKGKITARYEDGLSIEDIAERTKVSVEIVKSVLIEEGLLKEN